MSATTPVCHLTTPVSFPDAISALRFREHTLIQVHDGNQRKVAAENGLRSFFVHSQEIAEVVDADFVQVSLASFQTTKPQGIRDNQRLVVRVGVYSLSDMLRDRARIELAKRVALNDGHILHICAERIPSTSELAEVFSLAVSHI